MEELNNTRERLSHLLRFDRGTPRRGSLGVCVLLSKSPGWGQVMYNVGLSFNCLLQDQIMTLVRGDFPSLWAPSSEDVALDWAPGQREKCWCPWGQGVRAGSEQAALRVAGDPVTSVVTSVSLSIF